jgi:hypothetical protein
VFAGTVYVNVNAPLADGTAGSPLSAYAPPLTLTFNVKLVPSGSFVVPEITTAPPAAVRVDGLTVIVITTGTPASLTDTALDTFTMCIILFPNYLNFLELEH